MCIVGGRSGRKFPRWTEDSVHSPDKVGIFDLKSRLSRDLRLKVEITERAKPCRDPSALEFQNGKNSPTLQCFRILRLRSGQARGKQRSCSLQGLEECMEDGRLGFQRTFRTDTFLEQLVNHNGDPSPCFSKVLIPKDFKFFRKNTCRSVDSAWFIGALSFIRVILEGLRLVREREGPRSGRAWFRAQC